MQNWYSYMAIKDHILTKANCANIVSQKCLKKDIFNILGSRRTQLPLAKSSAACLSTSAPLRYAREPTPNPALWSSKADGHIFPRLASNISLYHSQHSRQVLFHRLWSLVILSLLVVFPPQIPLITRNVMDANCEF